MASLVRLGELLFNLLVLFLEFSDALLQGLDILSALGRELLEAGLEDLTALLLFRLALFEQRLHLCQLLIAHVKLLLMLSLLLQEELLELVASFSHHARSTSLAHLIFEFSVLHVALETSKLLLTLSRKEAQVAIVQLQSEQFFTCLLRLFAHVLHVELHLDKLGVLARSNGQVILISSQLRLLSFSQLPLKLIDLLHPTLYELVGSK